MPAHAAHKPHRPCTPHLAHSILTHSATLVTTHVPQVGALARLQELTLHGDCFKSHHFESLAALGGTLASLCLDTGISLPDCLHRMLALRTLVSKAGRVGPLRMAAHCDRQP